MKKKIVPSQNFQNQTQDLEKTFKENFEKLENLLKVIDQKNETAERSLRLEIRANIFKTEKSLEKTIQAQILVLGHELREELVTKSEMRLIEERLNKRITHVGDLITIAFSKKIANHEKRITTLEKTVPS